MHLKPPSNDFKTVLRALLEADSKSEQPIVQSASLFFWEQAETWAEKLSNRQKPFVIAITGASGSGKSFIREQLLGHLQRHTTATDFAQDNYYIDFESVFPELSLQTFYDEINLDDPLYIRFDKLSEDLSAIGSASIGHYIHIPQFRFGTPEQKPGIRPETLPILATPVILTEGIHAFYDTRTLPHYDLKIFVDIDENTRRNRWLERNIRDNRGTTDNMWDTTVSCLEQTILPAKEVADLVLNNTVSREQMSQFLQALGGIFGMQATCVTQPASPEITVSL